MGPSKCPLEHFVHGDPFSQCLLFAGQVCDCASSSTIASDDKSKMVDSQRQALGCIKMSTAFGIDALPSRSSAEHNYLSNQTIQVYQCCTLVVPEKLDMHMHTLD
eukprot:2287760-Amphidinium_carterae.2